MDQAPMPPCEVLAEMLTTGRTLMPDGSERKVMGAISPKNSLALYNTVLKERPMLVIEIGMAMGVSTLSILSALKQTGGTMISIDPYLHSLRTGEEWPEGRTAALHAVQRAGFSDLHRHIHAKSSNALPRLHSEGVITCMAYIDGAHDFANCFVDYFYLDKMLKDGGVLAFNDAGHLGVWATIKHLQRRGRYQEIDVGLAKSYAGRNPLITTVRWLGNVQRQDRYFRKLKSDPRA